MATNDLYNIGDEYINEAQSAMTGGGVRLPFPVAYIRWVNGKADQKDRNDARYFGGWEIGGDIMSEYLGNTQGSVPAGWTKIDQASKGGKEYEAYITRWIAFSPIARRERWEYQRDAQGKEFGNKRSHSQVLGYMATVDKGGYAPWGAVVLTAYGFAGTYIKSALDEFGIKTASARQEHANNLPSMFFWNLIGTFGERNQKIVGKGNNTSPITPCAAFVGKDDKLTAESLQKLFVGKEIVALRSQLLKQAQPWLDAWAKDQDSNGSSASENPEEPPFDYGAPSGDPNDIPF